MNTVALLLIVLAAVAVHAWKPSANRNSFMSNRRKREASALPQLAISVEDNSIRRKRDSDVTGETAEPEIEVTATEANSGDGESEITESVPQDEGEDVTEASIGGSSGPVTGAAVTEESLTAETDETTGPAMDGLQATIRFEHVPGAGNASVDEDAGNSTNLESSDSEEGLVSGDEEEQQKRSDSNIETSTIIQQSSEEIVAAAAKSPALKPRPKPNKFMGFLMSSSGQPKRPSLKTHDKVPDACKKEKKICNPREVCAVAADDDNFKAVCILRESSYHPVYAHAMAKHRFHKLMKGLPKFADIEKSEKGSASRALLARAKAASETAFEIRKKEGLTDQDVQGVGEEHFERGGIFEIGKADEKVDNIPEGDGNVEVSSKTDEKVEDSSEADEKLEDAPEDEEEKEE